MDLYYMELSPPSRAVRLVAKALGVPLNLKFVNLLAAEQLKPAFLAINPQHTLPTLTDKDFVMWEGGAILKYLVTKFDTKGKLYPSDAKTRSIVDRLLYFESGTLFPRCADYFRPLLLKRGPVDLPQMDRVLEALSWLELFLQGHDYVAANHLTLADYSLITVVTQMDPFDLDFSKYPRIQAWRKRCEKNIVAYHEINDEGVAIFTDIIRENEKSL